MYDVIFYKDKNGNDPIKEYLHELKEKSKSNKNDRIHFEKTIAYIKALQTYGTRIGVPAVKHIAGGLWELRPLNNRIIFFTGKITHLFCCTIL